MPLRKIAASEIHRKPNNAWVDHGTQFYHRSMKSWLHDSNIEIYWTLNEGKSVVAERFIRTLKSKIYKKMTAISKNMNIDRPDETVDEYNKTCHRTIKMKLANVQPGTYIDYGVEHNDKDPIFKVGIM